MRPTPIPDDEVWDGGERHVIGPPDGDPTNPTVFWFAQRGEHLHPFWIGWADEEEP